MTDAKPYTVVWVVEKEPQPEVYFTESGANMNSSWGPGRYWPWKRMALVDEVVAQAAEQRWVPVTERVPETVKPVFVYRSDGSHGEDWFRDGEWWRTRPSQRVTHWMPLPSPPQEKRDGQALTAAAGNGKGDGE